MTLVAPAKINLSLRVLRRREDGFHEIATRMVPLELADEILLEPAGAEGETFSCSDPELAGSGNLVMRAVEAVRALRPALPPLRIHLEKRIPHGAGLGGGSSDAAAILLALGRLPEVDMDAAEIARVAAELGSDIPFFLHRQACDCEGRGERVRPVASRLPELDLLLVKPPFPVPTPWAYGHWRDSAELPGIDYLPQQVRGLELVNDLERPVFAKHLVLADLKTWLREQPEVEGALLCGSGSTIFAALRGPGEGPELARRVRAEFGEPFWTCVTRTRCGA